jgi:hypothetical protein
VGVWIPGRGRREPWRESVTNSRPDDRAPIIPVCFASAPRQTLMLPGGSPPGIAPAASGRRGTKNRSRVGSPYPAFGVPCVDSPPVMPLGSAPLLTRLRVHLASHDHLSRLLIINTARESGATLRKAERSGRSTTGN